jgi:hypothetical protein
MKKLLPILVLFFCLVSCKKDNYLIPSSEVPKWIQERISHDEKVISSDPKSGLDIAAWIRYKYNSSYYFEYLNLLSSAGPEIYDSAGNKIKLYNEPYIDYSSKKCCRQFVWKGPSYSGE